MFCERIKKITEALYRVTDLLPDKEPLKWKLRNDAIEILDSLICAESKDFFDSQIVFDSLRKIDHFLQLISLSSTFVSSINFEILRREYVSLSDAIKEKLESRKNEMETLSINNLLPAVIVESNGQEDDGKKLLNGQKINNGHKGQENKEETKGDNEIKIMQKIIAEEQPVLLKERKRKIMSLIKENEWLSIRDIAASMPGIGEKSIQRDLLKMVDSGVLKKTGDKRWRKYSLV